MGKREKVNFTINLLCSWGRAGISKAWSVGQTSLLRCFLKIKFYCKIAMPTRLCVVCDHLHTTAAGLSRLSSCNRDHMATQPKIFTVWPFTEYVCQGISTYVYNHITSGSPPWLYYRVKSPWYDSSSQWDGVSTLHPVSPSEHNKNPEPKMHGVAI